MIVSFDIWCAFSSRTRVVCWVSWVATLSVFATFFLLFSGIGSGEALHLQRCITSLAH